MQLNKPCFTQLHYLVPQKSVISFPTEISALFPSLIEDINILVLTNQLLEAKKVMNGVHLTWCSNVQLSFK